MRVTMTGAWKEHEEQPGGDRLGVFTSEEVALSEVGLQRDRARVGPADFTDRSFQGFQECAQEVKIEEKSVVWSSRPTKQWVEPSPGIQDCGD